MSLYHNGLYAMNTRLDVLLYGISQQEGERIFFEISKITERIEQTISRFVSHSQVAAINNTRQNQPVPISNDLVEILSICTEYFDSTNGNFDITIAPLIELWKTKSETLPDSEKIAEVKNKTGYDKLQIDRTNQTIRKNVAGMQLDFGGFGKGYAVQKINEYLQYTDVEAALICFGNSTIYAIGHHPFGEYWSLGIYNVMDKKQSIHEIRLRNQALSTSGITDYDSKKHQLQMQSLLINPKTGNRVPCAKTLSVISHSPLEAEILSTTLLVCSNEDKKQIMERFNEIQVVEIDYSNTKNIKKHCSHSNK